MLNAIVPVHTETSNNLVRNLEPFLRRFEGSRGTILNGKEYLSLDICAISFARYLPIGSGFARNRISLGSRRTITYPRRIVGARDDRATRCFLFVRLVTDTMFLGRNLVVGEQMLNSTRHLKRIRREIKGKARSRFSRHRIQSTQKRCPEAKRDSTAPAWPCDVIGEPGSSVARHSVSPQRRRRLYRWRAFFDRVVSRK